MSEKPALSMAVSCIGYTIIAIEVNFADIRVTKVKNKHIYKP